MLQTPKARRGAVVAPHHLAAQAGLRILRDGGNAIEAMVGAAATIAVVYPHMNSLGGDNFWLIHAPGAKPIGIDACGAAAAKADVAFYQSQGYETIPPRGSLAALTVAGAVSGWQEALRVSAEQWGGRMPLEHLLEDAKYHSRAGVPVTVSQHCNTLDKREELRRVPGFARAFLDDSGEGVPQPGTLFRQPALAETLNRLGEGGLDSFYRGDLARDVAADLERVGSPLTLADLERHRAIRVALLSVAFGGHAVYNLPPPTQGLACLILLAVFDRLGVTEAEGFDHVHGLVEATKCAFRVRDRHVTDPAYMDVDPAEFLTDEILDAMAAGVDRNAAAPWPEAGPDSDTVWLGAVDGAGRAVSFIQSIYWEFGAGVVLDETGITWQNRGTSFSLKEGHHNGLRPGRRPFHTIQPALALLEDGRALVYGAMGGEGQPQTQAMIFSRHVLYDQDLQTAINAPRWLLGRTWGADTTNLRIENRFDQNLIDALFRAGHNVELVGPFEEVIMGHAGGLVHHRNGLIEGAADPRGDGGVAMF